MVSELISGLSAFTQMISIAKSIKDTNNAVVRNSAVADLWEQILDAQQRYATAIEQIRSLEEKLASFEAWDTEKQRYELTKVGEHGALAYSLKEGVQPPEEHHYLCTNCYSDRKKSILQEETRVPSRAKVLVCHRCDADIYLVGSRRTEHPGKAGAWGRRKN